ncbi:MAG: phosphodiesterase [Roseiarcus sp.]
MLIAQISDLHIRPAGQLAYGVAETNVMAERAIHALLRLRPRPDVVIVTGDAADCGLAEEYAILIALIARLPCPAYVIPGNHDRREAMRAAFAPLGRFGAHGPLNFAVDVGPLRLVGLDSVVEGASHGELSGETLAFLEAELNEHRDRPTIVCLHHPPFDCGIAHMDRIRLVTGCEDLARIVGAHPQVERILAGHHHRSIQARFAGTICQIAPSVGHAVALDLSPDGAAAFVLEPPAFLLHQWDEGVGLVTHTAFVDRAPGPFPFLLPPEYPGG